MIVNNLSEQCKTETREKDSETDSDRESVHSNWSDVMPIKVNKLTEVITNDTTQRKRTVRNIVLVPYRPKPKDWGSLPMQLALLLVLFWMMIVKLRLLTKIIKMMKVN